MVLTHVATLTVIAMAAGSAALVSGLLDGNEQTQTTITPEVQLWQCVPTQDAPASGAQSAMAAYCKSAYPASLQYASWATLFQGAWR